MAYRWQVTAIPLAEALEEGTVGEPFAVVNNLELSSPYVITKVFLEDEGVKSSVREGPSKVKVDG